MAQSASGRIVCSQCQRPMIRSKSSAASPICDGGIALDETEIIARPPAPPIRTDDWSARRHARELDRKLRPASNPSVTAAGFTAHSKLRFDPPQSLFDHLENVTTSDISQPRPYSTLKKTSSRHREGSQMFAWLVVAVGAMVLATGVGLLGWSIVNNQTMHWNLAISLALGGQGALIFGLALVVSRLWRSSRQASLKLQEMHARLGELQHTADALTAMRSGGAPAFYAELVRGASPQMLLTNLKGQLDQLATRLGSYR
jgi:hypothetical protein